MACSVCEKERHTHVTPDGEMCIECLVHKGLSPCTSCNSGVEKVYFLRDIGTVCEHCLEELGAVECSCCGVPAIGTVLIDGKHVCRECLPQRFVLCSHCGKYHPRGEARIRTHNGDVFGDCRREYSQSAVDSLYYKTSELIELHDGHKVHPSQMEHCVPCDVCGEPVLKDRGVRTKHHKPPYKSKGLAHINCLKEVCPICENRTDSLVELKHMNWEKGIPYNTMKCCTSCAGARVPVRHHSFVRDPLPFHGESDDELYLGCEIEMEMQKPESQLNAKLLGGIYDPKNGHLLNYTIAPLADYPHDGMETHIHAMHDGSLDNGVELVTAPMTLNYIRRAPFEKFFKRALALGWRAYDGGRCGLHIHVSRKFFGDTVEEQDVHITKVVSLVERHWDYVAKFTRRSKEKLDHWAQRYSPSKDLPPDDLMKLAKGDSAKYRAVNLRHPNTIEFRVFRGTLSYKHFMAICEFTEGLCRVAKKLKLGQVVGITWEQLLSLIYQEVNQEHLGDFVDEHLEKWKWNVIPTGMKYSDIKHTRMVTEEEWIKSGLPLKLKSNVVVHEGYFSRKLIANRETARVCVVGSLPKVVIPEGHMFYEDRADIESFYNEPTYLLYSSDISAKLEINGIVYNQLALKKELGVYFEPAKEDLSPEEVDKYLTKLEEEAI